jgi:hypothetical protein
MTLVTGRSKWLLQQIKFYDGNDFKTIKPGNFEANENRKQVLRKIENYA